MAKLPAFYSLLFALSLVLINPWGFQRAEIWTQPKLLAMHAITICNSWVILHFQTSARSLNHTSHLESRFGLLVTFPGGRTDHHLAQPLSTALLMGPVYSRRWLGLLGATGSVCVEKCLGAPVGTHIVAFATLRAAAWRCHCCFEHLSSSI